jgi:hypothetical protein
LASKAGGLRGPRAWQAACTAYGAVAVAVLYNELRVAREGIDPDQIAAVFD